MPSTVIESYDQEQIIHALDYIGEIYKLPRFPQETISHYRNRLMMLYSMKADSTAQGIVNQLTLDIGCLPLDIFEISADTDYKKYVYFEKNNHTFMFMGEGMYEIDLTSYIPKPETSYAWYVGELIEHFSDIDYIIINQLQEAEILDTLRTSNIRNFTTHNVMQKTNITKTVTKLPYKNIFEIHSNSNLMVNEVESIEDIEQDGDFFLDKEKGILYINSTPKDNNHYVWCSHNSDRHIVQWMPFNIQELQDKVYTNRLMLSIQQDVDNLDPELFIPSHTLVHYMLESYKNDGNHVFYRTLDDNKRDYSGKSYSVKALNSELEQDLSMFYLSNKNVRNLIGR
jgi:hypothetical protein